MDADAARTLALALPEAVEADHHGSPSFRVGGKIFATLPDEAHLHVMAAEDEIRALAASGPAYEQLWWGGRLACVRVTLAAADPVVVAETLAEAWRRKAPRALARAFDASGDDAT